MTANDNSPDDGHEGTDTDYYSALRAATADLAALRWDREGLEADRMDEWEDLRGHNYSVGRLAVDDLTASVVGEYGHITVDAGQAESPALAVDYSDQSISLELNGQLGSGTAGALANLTPAQAREAAAMLAQAAEELERRREIEAGRDSQDREVANGD